MCANGRSNTASSAFPSSSLVYKPPKPTSNPQQNIHILSSNTQAIQTQSHINNLHYSSTINNQTTANMSTDFGRKDLSDKVGPAYLHCSRTTLTHLQIEEKITPQSAKGPIDVTKEHATGQADHVARFVFHLLPSSHTTDMHYRDLKTDEHKSTGQSMHDKVSRMTSSDTPSTTGATTIGDHSTTATGDHKSVVDKVKDAIPGLHSDKRSDAAEVMDPKTSTTTTDAVNKNL